MKKIDSWLTKHGLKNRLTLVVIVIFIIFLILLFMFVNLSDEDTGQITITENAELRTGPNAAYPVIYKIEKGKSFKKIDRKGKWIEVQNHAGTEKGWVAGWHTNLNIPADQSLSSNPLKGKTIVLDPGHGGSDQGASSSTPSKSLEKNYTLKTAKELKKIKIVFYFHMGYKKLKSPLYSAKLYKGRFTVLPPYLIILIKA